MKGYCKRNRFVNRVPVDLLLTCSIYQDLAVREKVFLRDRLTFGLTDIDREKEPATERQRPPNLQQRPQEHREREFVDITRTDIIYTLLAVLGSLL